MLSVQNEQTKEKLELQKGDEKEEYQPPKGCGEAFLFICMAIFGVISIIFCTMGLGIKNYCAELPALIIVSLYLMHYEGVFSKKQTKLKRINRLIVISVEIFLTLLLLELYFEIKFNEFFVFLGLIFILFGSELGNQILLNMYKKGDKN